MEIGKYILLSILLPIRETTYSSAVSSIMCLSFTLCVIIPTDGQNQLFHLFVFHNITVFGLVCSSKGRYLFCFLSWVLFVCPKTALHAASISGLKDYAGAQTPQSAALSCYMPSS